MEKNVIQEVFSTDVFNDEVMREKLPKDVYKSWKKPWKTVKIWILRLQM